MISLSKHQEKLLLEFFQLLDKQSKREYRNQIPDFMHIPSVNHLKSYEWKLVKNTNLSESYFNKNESIIGCKLPQIYQAWLMVAYTFPFRIGRLVIYGNNPTAPLSEMDQLLTKELSSKQLFPVGKDIWSLWPVVFDFKTNEENPPLKIYTPSSKFHTPKLNDEIVFSSFEHFLACWIFDVGEGRNSRIDQKNIYKEFGVIDPASKPYWDDVISVMQDWDDMKP